MSKERRIKRPPSLIEKLKCYSKEEETVIKNFSCKNYGREKNYFGPHFLCGGKDTEILEKDILIKKDLLFLFLMTFPGET